jgi:beta-catenin-like protein 1
MNVDEFLYSRENKKQSSEEAENYEASRKRQKMTTEHLNEEEKIRILKLLESEPDQEQFSESQLKKLLNQLEKKVTRNQEMRIKFPEQPEKFMDSEVELNETIQEMHVVSTRADMYPIVLATNCMNVLLGLLSHENIDISAAVILLLQELTDLESNSLEGIFS